MDVVTMDVVTMDVGRRGDSSVTTAWGRVTMNVGTAATPTV